MHLDRECLSSDQLSIGIIGAPLMGILLPSKQQKHLKTCRAPQRKPSSSNQHFSGPMLVLGSEYHLLHLKNHDM